MEPRPNLGKGKLELKLFLRLAEFLTLCQDFGLPLLRRLVSAGLYIHILMGIFMLTEDNLVTQGGSIIMGGFYLAFFKACGEQFFEVCISFMMSLIHNHLTNAPAKISQDVAIARTVAGQIGSGTVVSSVVVICAPLNGWTSGGTSMIVAACAGIGVSYLTLFANWLLEHPPPHASDHPYRNPFPTAAKLVFSVCIAIGTTYFTMDALLLRSVVACGMATVGMELLVMKVLLVETSTVICENEFEGVYKPNEGAISHEDDAPERVLASPTWAVLTSRRMVVAPCGILAGAIMGLQFSHVVGHFTEYSQGAFASLIFGTPSGIIAGLAVNAIMEKPPLVFALFSGTTAYITVSMWNGLVAILAACIVGVVTGSLVEQFGLPCGYHTGVRTKFQQDVFWRAEKILAREEAEAEEVVAEARKRSKELGRDHKWDSALLKAHQVSIDKLALMDHQEENLRRQSAVYKDNNSFGADDSQLKALRWELEGKVSTSDADNLRVAEGKFCCALRRAAGAGPPGPPAGAPPPGQMALDNYPHISTPPDGPGTPGTPPGGQLALGPPGGGHQLAIESGSPEPPGGGDHQLAIAGPPQHDDGQVQSRMHSKQVLTKERVHSNDIVDGFELEPHGSALMGSDAGTPASSKPPSSRTQGQQLAVIDDQPSNARPKPAPAHVKEHPSFNDDLEPPDVDLMGRWEFREAPCDTMESGEALDAWRSNPVIPPYIPPGCPSASIWKVRQEGIANPDAPKARPQKQTLRASHDALAGRKPKQHAVAHGPPAGLHISVGGPPSHASIGHSHGHAHHSTHGASPPVRGTTKDTRRSSSAEMSGAEKANLRRSASHASQVSHQFD